MSERHCSACGRAGCPSGECVDCAKFRILTHTILRSADGIRSALVFLSWIILAAMAVSAFFVWAIGKGC